MDPTLKTALIAFADGAIGSVLTVVIGPHINWGIEKRRETMTYKRKLIANARAMIAELAQNEVTRLNLLEILERREEYHAIKGHLNENVIDDIHRGNKVIFNSTIAAGLSYLADEVDRLEKKWKLV